MPRLLRVAQRGRWYESGEEALDFRPSDEVSVWEVATDGSNLERVVAAFAARRDKPGPVDYVLIEQSVVDPANIVESEGETPDTHANATWHRDLKNLSETQINEVIEHVKETHPSGVPYRLSQAEVIQLIDRTVAAGHLPMTALKPKVAKAVAAIRASRKPR